MHTGTLIGDLMAAVERAERNAQQKRVADERESHWLYEFQVPQDGNERNLAGAA